MKKFAPSKHWLARLADPVFWPVIARRVRRRFPYAAPIKARRQNETADRQKAREFCQIRAMTNAQLLRDIGAKNSSKSLLIEEHQDVLKRASVLMKTCPIIMGGAGNMELIYALCEHVKAMKVVETGVAYGWSSLAILLSLSHRSGAELHSIDLPYPERKGDDWVGIVVPNNLREPWKLYRMADREGLPRVLSKIPSFDLAHYDSDKSAEGRLWAYPEIWAALRPGGVLISDDVSDNMAFFEFCASIELEPMIVRVTDSKKYENIVKLDEDKYQGVLFKS